MWAVNTLSTNWSHTFISMSIKARLWIPIWPASECFVISTARLLIHLKFLKMRDHLSAVHDYLFNIFTSTLHTKGQTSLGAWIIHRSIMYEPTLRRPTKAVMYVGQRPVHSASDNLAIKAACIQYSCTITASP